MQVQRLNFLQNYIKTKKFNPDFGKLYQSLLDWREESDYAVMGEFYGEDIIPLIQKVKNLNDALLKEINSKI